MADKANIPVPAGLPDMSKINYADVTPDEAQGIQASTEKYLQDLENRYAQPNWWKVAAGFAKPQLGGFMASLGSASDALGENIEQQRAIAPSISLMRAQLAQQQPGIRQAQKAASMASGRTGPVTEDYVRQLEELGDTPVARAARKSYESAQRERELAHSEFVDAMSRVQYARTQPGMTPDPRDLAIISKASNTQQTDVGPKPPMPDVAAAANNSLVEPPIPRIAPSALGMTATPNAKPEDVSLATQLSPEMAKAYALATAPLPDYLSGDPNTMSPQTKAAVESFRAAQERAKEDLLGLAKEGVRHGIVPSMGKSPAAAPAPQPAKATTGLSTEQQIKVEKENEEGLAAARAPRLSMFSNYDKQQYVDKDAILTKITKILSDPEVKQGVGQLYSDPGVKTALAKTLAQGINLSASSGLISGSLSAQLPVEKAMTGMTVSANAQKKIRELEMYLGQLESGNLRESLAASGAGGHANVPEFQNAISRIVTSSDPSSILQSYAAKEHVKNMRSYDHFKTLNQWRKANPGIPTHNYLDSEQHNAVVDKYAPDLNAAYGN